VGSDIQLTHSLVNCANLRTCSGCSHIVQDKTDSKIEHINRLLQITIGQAKTQDYDKLEVGELSPLNIKPRLIPFLNIL
jgi:hypothetical protein